VTATASDAGGLPRHHGLQCGFCTPGMIMSAIDLVKRTRARSWMKPPSATNWKAISAAARATTTSSKLDGRAGRRGIIRDDHVSRKPALSMTGTGVGARVKRKEDQRFITGKGQYTDDINLKDQTYAYFVRSRTPTPPSSRSTPKKAKAMPGVLGDVHRRACRRRQDRRPDLRLDDPSKDGTPMKAGPHPILAPGQGALCRRPCGRRRC
jgi:hypothetical protein